MMERTELIFVVIAFMLALIVGYVTGAVSNGTVGAEDVLPEKVCDVCPEIKQGFNFDCRAAQMTDAQCFELYELFADTIVGTACISADYVIGTAEYCSYINFLLLLSLLSSLNDIDSFYINSL